MNRNNLFDILLKADHTTLIRLCQTNREMANICKDDYFWQSKIRSDYDQMTHLVKRNFNVGRVIQIKPKDMSYREFYYNLIRDKMHLILVDDTRPTKTGSTAFWVFDNAYMKDVWKAVDSLKIPGGYSGGIRDKNDKRIYMSKSSIYGSEPPMKEITDVDGVSYWDAFTTVLLTPP